MSCKNKNTYRQLFDVVKDETIAKKMYDSLSSFYFTNKFGDWLNNGVDPSQKRTNAEGEPNLFSETKKDGKIMYYFLDKDFNHIYYSLNENNEQISYTPRSFENLNFKNKTSNLKEVVNTISNSIFLKYIKENFNNLENIENINIEKEITDFIDLIRTEDETIIEYLSDEKVLELMSDQEIEAQLLAVEERELVLNGIENNIQDMKSEILSFFRSKSLIINEEEQDQDYFDDDKNEDRGGQKDSIEKNSKDKASANVKLLLSFLPEYKINPKYTLHNGQKRFLEKETYLFASKKLIEGNKVHEELLDDLSDVITEFTTSNNTDIYETMISIIQSKVGIKPHYKDLLDLLDQIDDNKKTEFAIAMMHSKNNLMVSDINIQDRSFKTFNAIKQNSVQAKIIKNWEYQFNKKFKSQGKFVKPEIDSIKAKMFNVMNNHNAIFKTDLNTVTDERFFKDVARSFTNDSGTMGILKSMNIDNIDNNLLYSMIENVSNGVVNLETKTNIKNMISQFNKDIYDSLKDLSKNSNKKNYSFIKNNQSRLFDKIANIVATYQNDIKDSSVMSMSKMFWAYGNPSFISNRINTFKKNPEKLRELKENNNINSVYIDYLLADDIDINGGYVYQGNDKIEESKKRLENFQLGRLLEVKINNEKKQDSVDNKKISETDQIVDRINKGMQGSVTDKNGNLTNSKKSIFPTIVPADKSTSFEITYGLFINETADSMEGDTIQFSQKIKNIYYNYFIDEYNRMVDVINEIKSLPHQSLRMYYHTDKNGNVGSYVQNGKDIGIKTYAEYEALNNTTKQLTANGLKSQIFGEFNYKNLLNSDANIFKSDNTPRYGKNELNDENHKKELTSRINTILNTRVTESIDSLIKKRIIEPKGEMFNFNGLSKEVIRSYSDNSNYLTKPSLQHLMSDYMTNAMIANVEYTKLFTGDPAYYKNMVDFFKRVPATYTDGINMRLKDNETDSKFNIAVIENQVIESEYYKELESSLKLLNIKEKDIESIIGKYKEVNQTDAQAWITPQRWRFILDKTGKWSDAHNTVYDKMIGKNNEPFTLKELKMSAQPVKGVYFGLVGNTPTYMKYSQAVLSPILVKGTELESLYNSMVKNKIDEAVTMDGVKVGSIIPNSIKGDNITLNKLVLSNADWKIQQDLPVKLMKDTLLGSQIQKNIYSSVNENGEYEVNGTTYNGNELIDHINDIISSLSNENINLLNIKLGKDSSNVIDINEIYNIIEEEIYNNPDQYTENVKQGVYKKMQFEALPSLKNKLYSILFSRIRKAGSNIKTNGGSFIQMSNYGLDKKTASEAGVIWLVDQEKGLRPPTLYIDENGEKKQRPGQIFISHSDIYKHIPNYKELAKEGKLKAMLDENLLKAIGYRIPNQGMSSNDALEIVGILPAHMNDTIVAYSEITTKTGSDFDIDKMYIMLPEFRTLYSKESTKSAIAYLKKNDYTESEIKEMLLEDGYIQDSVDYLENVFEEYVNEIFLKGGDNELYNDYVKEFGIGEVTKLVKVKSNKNSKKGMNNMLFDAYWSILTHEDTYSDLIQPIDFDFLQNHIKELNPNNETGESLKYYDPLYQIELKNTYMLGKSGVGISANMAVDHNISKGRTNLTFRDYYLGVGYQNNKGETVFDQNPETNDSYSQTLKSENKAVNGTKFKIGNTISAFMNAFVDNAKDPYIQQGNYNTYTSGVGFMLTRAGVHPYYINAFIGQPILKELSTFVNNHESLSIGDEIDFKGMSAYNIILYKEVGKYLNTRDKKEIRTFLKNKSKNPRVFTYDQLIDSYDNNNNILNNIDVLLKFKEWQDQSKKLDASVNLSRFDTIGSGTNHIDMMLHLNNLINMMNNNGNEKEIYNHQNKYIKNGKITSLGTQLLNTVYYAYDILNANPNVFLSANDKILNVINNITMSTSSSYGGSMGLATNRDLIADINKNIYNFIMAQYPLFKINESPLTYINKIKEKVIDYKTKQDSDNRNEFIDSLTFYDNSFGIDMGNIDNSRKNIISNAFYDLYRSDLDLAKDIIIASFHMNGFNQSLIDFNEMIPHEFFINSHKLENGQFQSLQEFINQKLMSMNNSEFISSFHREYIQNNIENTKIIPNIAENKLVSLPKSNNLKVITDEFLLKNYAITDVNETGDLTSYSSYIKTSKAAQVDEIPDFDSFGNIIEYKYNPSLLEYKGNIEYKGKIVPLYQVIETKGYVDKKSKIKINEYNVQSTAFDENKKKVKQEILNSKQLVDGRYFVHESKTSNFLDNKEFKNANQVREFIFNNNINKTENFTASEENVVSLQDMNEINKIYSQLGNKTVSENVTIIPVYQKQGIEAARDINGIFSLRVNNSNKHFGNPFSSVSTEIAKGLTPTKSTKESVEKYIDWVINSQEERAQWIREQLKSGELKGKPIIYYKELGEPSHATALDYLINEYDWNNNQQQNNQLNLFDGLPGNINDIPDESNC